ncbi:hypothetical protein MTO96_005029 [Rhipicephalus appendiculatus]
MSSYYELPANASEDVLRLKIDEVHGKLLSLNISNCIVAQPAGLLSLLPRLQCLQSLSCIACPLRASVLLEHLLTSLQNVAHLEFSFIATERDAKEELSSILRLKNLHKDRETQLRTMYAEVAEGNMEVLMEFALYCPHVTYVHLHFQHFASFRYGIIALVGVFEHLRSLDVFASTCEAQSVMQCSRASIDRHIHANVVYSKERGAIQLRHCPHNAPINKSGNPA